MAEFKSKEEYEKWKAERSKSTQENVANAANERKMLSAADIVVRPEIMSAYDGRYVIIWDRGIADGKLHNFNNAICIMAEMGWRPISITGYCNNGAHMYALMERCV